ncbi:CoA transferase [Sphingomonas flavalba]|uniref:CoA transferase n=1 Tax=Sphingomonas flavalba TaxID=2559804 RepID=UPI0039E16A58
MQPPLHGLRVVEGAAFVAGPSCALMFAQLGAEVIRFDAIGGGPDYGRWPLAPDGGSLYWEGLNKGKKSIAVDLRNPEGRALAQRLATAGDGLFVTNYPADGFLAHQALIALRADLISVRVMGWPDGRQAVDYTVNAATGFPLLTGPLDATGPVNHVLPAWDLLTGAQAAFALLAALRARDSGHGGHEIRLALSDVAAATLGMLGMVGEVTGGAPARPRAGNDLYGLFGRDFATADGQTIMIVAITPRQWTGLVGQLGLNEAVGAIEAEHNVSFERDEGARYRLRDRLIPLFARAIGERTLETLGPALDQAGMCWAPYQTMAEAVTDPAGLVADNPLFTDVSHPAGRYPTAGFAGAFGGWRAPGQPAPRLGANTDEVLVSLLGLSSGEIAGLHDRGVVA